MSDVVEYAEKTVVPFTPPPSPALDQLKTLLIEGEALCAFALQHRLHALIHRRKVAAATSGRFIFMRRPLFGGYEPVDVRWQDLKDARLTVGMFSATLTVRFSNNRSDTASGEGGLGVIQASGLTKIEAQALYRVCQTEEQAWREKRRVRSIEEMRAASGGVQVATAVYPNDPPGARAAATPAGEDDPAVRLGKARRMLEQGLITDAEFEGIKARIVSAL